ncbi:hypothetical protein pp2_038 [Vibrio phage phi-pp2]|uniref:Uncharacterized protein n=1 Tax=Vibrio phage phi-pp2 TaxID=1204514 RepID=I6X210_9CAUD|nr:hypothetical protein pp2_038 [Vibrio phage phi-pp2]
MSEVYQMWEKKIQRLDEMHKKIYDMGQLAAGDEGKYIFKTEMKREHLSREISHEIDHKGLDLHHLMYKGLHETAREYQSAIMIFCKEMPLEQRRELFDKIRAVFNIDAYTDEAWEGVLKRFKDSLLSQGMIEE